MMRAELKNKIWLVTSATFAFAMLFGWYGSTKPVFYESKTLLTLKQPTISGRITPDLTEEDLEKRIFNLNQQILSRTILEPMIGKYRLFEKEKSQGMPIELIIEKMQKNIRIEPQIEPQKERIEVVGFSITYRDSNPENARNVAAELAGKYVNATIGSCCQCQNEDDFQTEKIQIVDPANLPTSPKSFTTKDFALFGAGFGLIFSLFILSLASGVNYLNSKYGKVVLQ